MQINYCDLCSSPLKDNNYWMLYISEPKTTNFNELDYYSYLKKVEKGVKEICPTCKHVFDKMFELRLHRLSELTEEIMKSYNFNKKDKNNEKEKK